MRLRNFITTTESAMNKHDVDVGEIEHRLSQYNKQRDMYAEQAPIDVLPMPEYVQHKEGVGEIGRLSAEAVASEYEAAAKAIEKMGADLTEMQRKLDAETQALHEAQDEVKALAALYREKCIAAFNRIEEASLVIQGVRDLCRDNSERIGKT
jgi:hypothetical protein